MMSNALNNGVSTSPTSVVLPQFLSSDQTEISTAPPADPEAPDTFTSTRYETIFEVDDRTDTLTCHFLLDTEYSNKILELQTKTHDDGIFYICPKFWREWHEIGVFLKIMYPPERMESFLSPSNTWKELTDDLIREDDEFVENLKAPPEDTTEFTTAPPENKTEMTAASIETDGGTFTTENFSVIVPPSLPHDHTSHISTSSPNQTSSTEKRSTKEGAREVQKRRDHEIYLAINGAREIFLHNKERNFRPHDDHKQCDDEKEHAASIEYLMGREAISSPEILDDFLCEYNLYNNFLFSRYFPDGKAASTQEASENSEASPADTKESSTAPPEILTAPPERTRGLLSDKFGKEATGPNQSSLAEGILYEDDGENIFDGDAQSERKTTFVASTNITPAPPERLTSPTSVIPPPSQLLKAKDTDTSTFTWEDGTGFWQNLTAPPDTSTTSQPNTTTPDLIPVKGLLLDNFSEKEANSPPIEEYFDREIVNFQQEIDKVLSDDAEFTEGDDDKIDDGTYNNEFTEGDGKLYNNHDKEIPLDGAENFYKEDQLLFDGKLLDGDGVSSTTSRKDTTEKWTAPPKHSTAPPANTMELLTAQPTENEDDFPEANQRFINGIIFNGDGDSTDSRESVLGVESRRQKFYDENRGHQKLCDNRDLDGDKQKFLFDGKLFDGNGARQQVHDNEKVDKEQIHDDIFGDNSTHEKRPAAPATMIPTTLSTEHKESVLDINRKKKKEISAGDTSFDEKQPPTPAKLTKPTAAPAKDGIISTKSRGSVLDVLRNQRDSFDEHFSDDSPTGGDAWSTKKKKKKKEKLPRFRSDGTPSRPMRRLIRFYDGATSDDSAEATKASPVVVNSLSAWREEKYHGDGGVPHGDQMNFDHDGAYYGDGDHNFHSERQYFREGEQHFYNNEDQHFNNDDTDFYDGDGEFHGGHDNLDDGAEQSFYHNEYDGKHFADDY